VPYVIASTAIARIEYDDLSHRLLVTFTSGRSYTYYDVPRGVYWEFASASSKGQFFNAYIKDRYDR
jgi:hypothetical protein